MVRWVTLIALLLAELLSAEALLVLLGLHVKVLNAHGHWWTDFLATTTNLRPKGPLIPIILATVLFGGAWLPPELRIQSVKPWQIKRAWPILLGQAVTCTALVWLTVFALEADPRTSS